MSLDSIIFPGDDLVVDDTGDSPIQNYFAGATVFITGGTGFLGKLLLEKLLRTCRGVDKIYILIRQKKKDDSCKRLEKLFEDCVFHKVRKGNCLKKVVAVAGDLAQKNLGLSEDDLEMLVSEVSCVFHVGATVRFNEKIRSAAHINVRATWDLLELARQMKNLKAFVHVSTAFSFCVRQVIDEVKYRSKVMAEHLVTLVEALDEDELEKITSVLLGSWPNTYTFTKAIAEDLIVRKYTDLPVGILRPSIVVSTAKEPLAGWTDNFGGLTGLVLGREMGVIRVLRANVKRAVEVVPADYVVNSTIAVAWDVGTKRIPQRPPIYNYVSSCQTPVNLHDSHKIFEKVWQTIPSVQSFAYPFFVNTLNPYLFTVLHFFLHIGFSYVCDGVNVILKKPTYVVKRYKKIDEQLAYLSYFTMNEWTFTNFNTQRLWKDLSLNDQQLFNFNMGSHNWEEYIVPYVVGLRFYLLKESMDTVPEGLKKLRRLKLIHYTLISSLVGLAMLFLYCAFFKLR